MAFLFIMENEIWKNIKGFEDYQVSNFGRVKSLKRGKEKILKNIVSIDGYYIVNLHKKNKRTTKKIHQLVAIAFLNHNPDGYKLVINHKDINRQNNNLNNLEIVTARENSNRKHLKGSSIYTGVSWHKLTNKWTAQIVIDGKKKYLGLFINELEASCAYQNALNNI